MAAMQTVTSASGSEGRRRLPARTARRYAAANRDRSAAVTSARPAAADALARGTGPWFDGAMLRRRTGLLLLALVCAPPAGAAAAAPAAAPQREEPASLLGPKLELGTWAFSPPAGFQPLDLAAGETGALAPAPDRSAGRLVLTLVREPDTLFAVSRIDRPWDREPGMRDRLARAALDQLREAVGVELRLLSVEPLEAGVRLTGRYRLGGREREILLAWRPAGEATAVFALAAPREAIGGLAAAFDASVASFVLREASREEAGPDLGLVAFASLLLGAGAGAIAQRRLPPPTKRRGG